MCKEITNINEIWTPVIQTL